MDQSPPTRAAGPVARAALRRLTAPPPANLRLANDDFGKHSPAAAYLGRLSERSRLTQASALTVAARLLGQPDVLRCPWSALTAAHTAALRAKLSTRYAPATGNRILAAVRGVLRAAWRLGLLDRDACERACDVPPIAGRRLLAGRALARAEVATLLASVAATPAGVRDAALIAVLWAGGLRRAELAALRLADYAPDTHALHVRHGKGDAERIVYVPAAAPLLGAYLRLRGRRAGALFLRARQGGQLTRGGLTPAGVRTIVQRVATAAGVGPLSPHDFRRTFISELLDAGADLSAAQQLAGHASPATTAKYDRRGERAKIAAAALLTLPDTPS